MASLNMGDSVSGPWVGSRELFVRKTWSAIIFSGHWEAYVQDPKPRSPGFESALCGSGKWFNCCKPPIPHLCNGDNITALMELSEGLTEILYVIYLAQCLANNQLPVKVTISTTKSCHGGWKNTASWLTQSCNHFWLIRDCSHAPKDFYYAVRPLAVPATSLAL